MSWLSIFLVTFAIGLAISPILALMPTQRQRELAKFRTHAATLGLRVRLVDFTTTNPSSEFKNLACYSLPWDASEITQAKKLSPWQLVKGDMNHDIHFAGVWDWGNKNLKAPNLWLNPLKELILQHADNQLFTQIKMLEQSTQGFHVYWTEKGDVQSVDKIAGFLKSFKAFALGENASIEFN